MSSPSPELTIVSWNMWCLNTQFDDAIEFIRSLDFDILCLQEIPEAFLDRLRSLPYHVAIGQDSIWTTEGPSAEKSESKDFLAIVSKYPIESSKTYPLPVLDQSWRVIATRTLMRLIIRTRVRPIRDRELLSAGIRIGDMLLQIFSCHFALLTPEVRRREFGITASHIDPQRKAIVCGDFNILDHWTMKPLNWLQGGRFYEMFPWYDERKHIGADFDKFGLANPLAGSKTQWIARGQLDHILVPKDATVLERNVLKDTHGSDHHPVSLKLRLAQ